MAKLPIIIASLNRKAGFFPDATCRGPGLSSGFFDASDGSIEIVDAMDSIDNPGFLAFHPRLPQIAVASEVHEWEEGVVTNVAVDPATMKLTYLNKQPTMGGCTSHLSFDRTADHLLATNYKIGDRSPSPGMSVVTFPMRGNGWLGPVGSAIALSGGGPVASRQEQAHAHCILATPDNRRVLVADLGADSVISIPFDAVTGRLSEEGMQVCSLPAGSGPRHFLLDGFSDRLYLLNELAGTLATIQIKDDGGMSIIGSVSTRHAGAEGHNDASDLQMSSDGRFIYAANRGDDTIAIFELDGDRMPAPRGHVPAGGHWPRNLAIDPSQSFLLVANQYSDTIAIFRRNKSDGSLHFERHVEHDTPMCVNFPGYANESFR